MLACIPKTAEDFQSAYDREPSQAELDVVAKYHDRFQSLGARIPVPSKLTGLAIEELIANQFASDLLIVVAHSTRSQTGERVLRTPQGDINEDMLISSLAARGKECILISCFSPDFPYLREITLRDAEYLVRDCLSSATTVSSEQVTDKLLSSFSESRPHGIRLVYSARDENQRAYIIYERHSDWPVSTVWFLPGMLASGLSLTLLLRASPHGGKRGKHEVLLEESRFRKQLRIKRFACVVVGGAVTLVVAMMLRAQILAAYLRGEPSQLLLDYLVGMPALAQGMIVVFAALLFQYDTLISRLVFLGAVFCDTVLIAVLEYVLLPLPWSPIGFLIMGQYYSWGIGTFYGDFLVFFGAFGLIIGLISGILGIGAIMLGIHKGREQGQSAP